MEFNDRRARYRAVVEDKNGNTLYPRNDDLDQPGMTDHDTIGSVRKHAQSVKSGYRMQDSGEFSARRVPAARVVMRENEDRSGHSEHFAAGSGEHLGTETLTANRARRVWTPAPGKE